MLMRINEYRQNYFTDGSRPTQRTVIGWIESGDIYGERKGKQWYVDPDRRVVKTDNPLVHSVLMQ